MLPSPGHRCAGAARAARRDRLRTAEATLLCLLDVQRVEHGLVPLTPSPQLRSAAMAHTLSMCRRRYFSHVDPDGDRLDRVRATGYLDRRSLWLLGETLAWGGGSGTRPEAIVAAFMRSPRHRAVILDGRGARA